MRIAFSALLLILCLAGFVTAEPPVIGIYADRLHDSNLTACPYCARPIRAGAIHQDAEALLIDELRQGLADSGVSYSLGRDDARSIQAFVFRFEERRGGNFAVERPASVGFHLHLLDRKRVIKVFHFDETQQPLSDNILKFGLFLRRGAKWVTSRELAEEGMEKGITFLQEDLR
jgi:hypothetical protein